jgi:peptidoglycan DL-endopeptidase CwlO
MSAAAKLAAVAVGAVLIAGAAGSHGHHAYGKGHSGVVAFARDHIGCAYVWGGTGPCSSGYDCSGLAMRAYAAAGIDIPRTSEEQWAAMRHESRSQLRPGDLIFYKGSDGTATAPGHVVIYIGGGKVIQAYSPGVPVEVSSLASMGAGTLVGYAEAAGK